MILGASRLALLSFSIFYLCFPMSKQRDWISSCCHFRRGRKILLINLVITGPNRTVDQMSERTPERYPANLTQSLTVRMTCTSLVTSISSNCMPSASLPSTLLPFTATALVSLSLLPSIRSNSSPWSERKGGFESDLCASIVPRES